MKHPSLFFYALFLSFTLTLQAQNPYADIKADIRKAGGVFNLYDFNTPSPAVAPKGFRPFYISHYGRHGSRMSSHNDTFEKMNEMLTEAYQNQHLTERGRLFFEMYKPLYEKFRLRGGDLTLQGQQEHNHLAHRMFNCYPAVFKGKSCQVKALSSNSIRSIMSMYAFLEGLRECRKDIACQSSASLADMNVANPFTVHNPDVGTTDAGFLNPHAAWADQLDAFRNRVRQPHRLLRRLFTTEEGLAKYGTPFDIELMFYEICESIQATGGKQVPWDIFDEEGLLRMWEWNNLKYYLSKGPAGHSKGRQWAFSWRTLEDVLTKADIAIKGGPVVADLRFGHDILIMSMMTLLDIEGWNQAVPDDSVKYVWKEYRVPLASNIQWIFYRNRMGDVLVRMMLNERDQFLPIASETAPYYRWEDFKAFALKRIQVARHIISTTHSPAKKKRPSVTRSSLG